MFAMHHQRVIGRSQTRSPGKGQEGSLAENAADSRTLKSSHDERDSDGRSRNEKPQRKRNNRSTELLVVSPPHPDSGRAYHASTYNDVSLRITSESLSPIVSLSTIHA